MYCTICQHAKIQSINAALDAKRAPNLVRAQYRLDPQMFAVHLTHRSNGELTSMLYAQVDHLQTQSSGVVRMVGEWVAPIDTEPPFTRFKQAWHDVKDDARERARMVAWLNEELQQDEMGL